MPPVSWEVILQGGAIVVLVMWVWDLRKERDALKDRLYRLLDKIDVAAKPDPK